MQQPTTFTQEGAERIARAVRAVEAGGHVPLVGDTLNASRRVGCFVRLDAVLTHPLWTATEVHVNGSGTMGVPPYGARTWDATTPLLVVGVPEAHLVAGQILRAECVGHINGGPAWVAIGQSFRVWDWGTGAQKPFVFEGGIMKAKTLKTTNGITWTQEKINISDEEC